MSRLHPAAAVTTVCALSAAALLAVPLAAIGAESGIRINEVESSGGVPGDWIEFVNTSSASVDLSGYVVKDNGDGGRVDELDPVAGHSPAGLDFVDADTGFGAGGGERNSEQGGSAECADRRDRSRGVQAGHGAPEGIRRVSPHITDTAWLTDDPQVHGW